MQNGLINMVEDGPDEAPDEQDGAPDHMTGSNLIIQKVNTFWYEKVWSKMGKMKCKMAKMRLKRFMTKSQ